MIGVLLRGLAWARGISVVLSGDTRFTTNLIKYAAGAESWFTR
jgi:ribonuclease BN (tRNA processing enzyme)